MVVVECRRKQVEKEWLIVENLRCKGVYQLGNVAQVLFTEILKILGLEGGGRGK